VNVQGFVAELRELARLPGVRIEMCGGEGCRLLYSAFTQRHARWRLIQNKRWGVALLRLPDTTEEYRQLVSSLMRRRVKHATRSAFVFTRIDPLARVDEIMAINRSTSERQGIPIHPDYLDEEKVRRYLHRTADVFGVVDANGVLQAYMCVRTCGEVGCLERMLGHADAIDEGLVYLLILGVVDWLISLRAAKGVPLWFMYDMFSGASPGMRQFKHVIGCQSYRVSWAWRD
jgi:hypothetical protein